MQGLRTTFHRELLGYFITPVAYVFIALFVLVSSAFTFSLSQLFERGQADLMPFFQWHPWLYLFFIPAISMRLWAEEKRSNTLELVLTMPVPLWQSVLGKYLAAWVFVAISLLATTPLWLTVSWLGNPDHGVIISSYAGSLWLASAYLAVGSCLSACTRNQVIAFVLSCVGCFVLTVLGFPLVMDALQTILPYRLLDVVRQLSLLTHYMEWTQGLVSLGSVLFYLSFAGLWLAITVLLLAPRSQHTVATHTQNSEVSHA